MQFARHLIAASLIALTTGCASGLNSVQEQELGYYRAQNLEVREKSPGAAAALGLLPGGGSFYGRAYGYGVANLLLWPVSIFWDPVSGYNAAESINYQATCAHVSRMKKSQMDALDTRLISEEIDPKHYALERRKIDEKFSNGY
ncbi:hypothetical protein [Pseudomonas sp. PONIH3]|uniref:hypothetical protein n=1 Tax=Pseudomonas sp. PONIH3 TaxID=1636610 RepID=UPI000CDBE1D7|nr:hypothetical protein [Pseudomonas sp. PONIH3]AUY32747.1 hypothetical protein C3F42_05685 [Pseudomonas sp. PONIH3]